jgi:phosphoribosylformylglycinamidine cyclo-ligase
MAGSAYAGAGVDYTKIQGFKDAMVAVARRTLGLPRERHGVEVHQRPHGASFRYLGSETHRWTVTQEGLGNKNWIAELMYQHTGKPHYFGIGIDAALMITNDLIANGSMPVLYMDEVAAGDSDWFADAVRAADLANGMLSVCQEVGMALGGGESPSLRYLVNAEAPVKSAPSLSGSVTGILAPAHREITGDDLCPGDRIIGVTSSGLHANGISLVIDRVMRLPEHFLTRLPNGRTVGEEALIPTRSYAGLVAAINRSVEVHKFLPGTGDGVAKLASDKRPFAYRIDNWIDDIPPLFLFMLEQGVSLLDCLKTFNWGIGYYIFVPAHYVDRVISIGRGAGYELFELGFVEEGKRGTHFEPNNLWLPPPGE